MESRQESKRNDEPNLFLSLKYFWILFLKIVNFAQESTLVICKGGSPLLYLEKTLKITYA